MIEEIKKKDISSYIGFIKEVFGYEPTKSNIEKYIKENKVLVIKKNEKVVASISIKEENDYIKGKKYYYINNLGVLKEYRREGYASSLFDEVEKLVVDNKIDYLLLTSGNQRRAAHYFYKARNFKIKDTTVFIKLY